MITAAGQRSLAMEIVPSCGAGRIILSVQVRPINRADLERIVPDYMRNVGIPSNSFAGIVVSVGQNVADKSFKVGDSVAGYVDAGVCVDVLGGGSQGYLQIQSERVWRISAAEAKRIGFIDPATGGGCSIA